jgi:hypothetical protein
MPCENSEMDTVYLALILSGLMFLVVALIWKAIKSSSKRRRKGAVAMVKIMLSHLQVSHSTAAILREWAFSVVAKSVVKYAGVQCHRLCEQTALNHMSSLLDGQHGCEVSSELAASARDNVSRAERGLLRE